MRWRLKRLFLSLSFQRDALWRWRRQQQSIICCISVACPLWNRAMKRLGSSLQRRLQSFLSLPLSLERNDLELTQLFSRPPLLFLFSFNPLLQSQQCAAGDSAAYARRNSTLDDVVIVSALRTPITKVRYLWVLSEREEEEEREKNFRHRAETSKPYRPPPPRFYVKQAKRGGLKDTSPDDLLSAVFEATIQRTGVDPKDIGDIVIGSVLGDSSQRAIQCRIAALLSGIPDTVPIHTVNRQCSSGLQAIASVAAAIKSGFYSVGLAGGVESMSTNPMAWEGGINPRISENENAQNCLLPMGTLSVGWVFLEAVVCGGGRGRETASKEARKKRGRRPFFMRHFPPLPGLLLLLASTRAKSFLITPRQFSRVRGLVLKRSERCKGSRGLENRRKGSKMTLFAYFFLVPGPAFAYPRDHWCLHACSKYRARAWSDRSGRSGVSDAKGVRRARKMTLFAFVFDLFPPFYLFTLLISLETIQASLPRTSLRVTASGATSRTSSPLARTRAPPLLRLPAASMTRLCRSRRKSSTPRPRRKRPSSCLTTTGSAPE